MSIGKHNITTFFPTHSSFADFQLFLQVPRNNSCCHKEMVQEKAITQSAHPSPPQLPFDCIKGGVAAVGDPCESCRGLLQPLIFSRSNFRSGGLSTTRTYIAVAPARFPRQGQDYRRGACSIDPRRCVVVPWVKVLRGCLFFATGVRSGSSTWSWQGVCRGKLGEWHVYIAPLLCTAFFYDSVFRT